MVQHKKKTSDHASARVSRKTKNGSIRRRLLLVDWFVNLEFSQVARNGRVETVVAQRNEFVLYSCINGQPVERSKIILGEI